MRQCHKASLMFQGVPRGANCIFSLSLRLQKGVPSVDTHLPSHPPGFASRSISAKNSERILEI